MARKCGIFTWAALGTDTFVESSMECLEERLQVLLDIRPDYPLASAPALGVDGISELVRCGCERLVYKIRGLLEILG